MEKVEVEIAWAELKSNTPRAVRVGLNLPAIVSETDWFDYFQIKLFSGFGAASIQRRHFFGANSFNPQITSTGPHQSKPGNQAALVICKDPAKTRCFKLAKPLWKRQIIERARNLNRL